MNSSPSLSPDEDSIIKAVSINCVVFGLDKGILKILLMQIGQGIRPGEWALPGGWIFERESLEAAAARVLKGLTAIDNLYLEQLRAFGGVDRFPGGRVITIAFSALVHQEDYTIAPGGPASNVAWYPLDQCPPLVFDHTEILQYALMDLRLKLRTEPVGFNLLPPKFTLLQLQELYEVVLGVKLDKPNFRRKIMNMKLLVTCDERQQSVAHRAAALFRFDEDVHQHLKAQGYAFEF